MSDWEGAGAQAPGKWLGWPAPRAVTKGVDGVTGSGFPRRGDPAASPAIPNTCTRWPSRTTSRATRRTCPERESLEELPAEDTGAPSAWPGCAAEDENKGPRPELPRTLRSLLRCLCPTGCSGLVARFVFISTASGNNVCLLNQDAAGQLGGLLTARIPDGSDSRRATPPEGRTECPALERRGRGNCLAGACSRATSASCSRSTMPVTLVSCSARLGATPPTQPTMGQVEWRDWGCLSAGHNFEARATPVRRPAAERGVVPWSSSARCVRVRRPHDDHRHASANARVSRTACSSSTLGGAAATPSPRGRHSTSLCASTCRGKVGLL